MLLVCVNFENILCYDLKTEKINSYNKLWEDDKIKMIMVMRKNKTQIVHYYMMCGVIKWSMTGDLGGAGKKQEQETEYTLYRSV